MVDDATALCYDYDAFGRLLDSKPFIEQIIKAQEKSIEREIEIGDNPIISYFTGKHEVFSVETSIGVLSAAHLVSSGLGGPTGASLKSRIFFSLAFEITTFDDAIERLLIVLRYVGLLSGRRQNLKSLRVQLPSNDEVPIKLDIYWPRHPRRRRTHNGEVPSPGEVLLSPVFQPREFSLVTADWFDRENEWKLARLRFFDGFSEQLSYDIDRLIRSANMFDILPASAVPPKVTLSADLASAKDEARCIFSSLPTSPEKHSILSALGRVGDNNLKQKVRHRAGMVEALVGERFPNLTNVTDEAVNARNYFVHGGDPRFDYAKHLDCLWFFSETLEFVFGCSDLIEAGWSMQEWLRTRAGMSHPFGRYRLAYGQRLDELKKTLASKGKTTF